MSVNLYSPDISIKKNLSYCGSNEEYWMLDLYIPGKRIKSPAPAIVVIHGGGWHEADKSAELEVILSTFLATCGFICASLNYRLSQVKPYPAALEDVKCAVRWLRAKANEYNIDSGSIGAIGHSAGGHLASLLALDTRKLSGDEERSWGSYPSTVQAVAALSGLFNLVNGIEFEKAKGAHFIHNFLAGPEEKLHERAREASPLTYVQKGAPPFLLIHGSADVHVPPESSQEFLNALKQAGDNDVTFITVENAGHDVYNTNRDEQLQGINAFFTRALCKNRE
jgi:acetyl esterase/lipase